jgi:hypothetical protein
MILQSRSSANNIRKKGKNAKSEGYASCRFVSFFAFFISKNTTKSKIDNEGTHKWEGEEER